MKVAHFQGANTGGNVVQNRVWHERLITSPDFDELARIGISHVVWPPLLLAKNLSTSEERSKRRDAVMAMDTRTIVCASDTSCNTS